MWRFLPLATRPSHTHSTAWSRAAARSAVFKVLLASKFSVSNEDRGRCEGPSPSQGSEKVNASETVVLRGVAPMEKQHLPRDVKFNEQAFISILGAQLKRTVGKKGEDSHEMVDISIFLSAFANECGAVVCPKTLLGDLFSRPLSAGDITQACIYTFLDACIPARIHSRIYITYLHAHIHTGI